MKGRNARQEPGGRNWRASPAFLDSLHLPALGMALPPVEWSLLHQSRKCSTDLHTGQFDGLVLTKLTGYAKVFFSFRPVTDGCGGFTACTLKLHCLGQGSPLPLFLSCLFPALPLSLPSLLSRLLLCLNFLTLNINVIMLHGDVRITVGKEIFQKASDEKQMHDTDHLLVVLTGRCEGV